MNIDLGPSGDFALTLPSGRKLFVPNTPHAAAFIYKLLWEGAHGHSDRGYIGAYPTQAIANAWMAKAMGKEAQDAFMAEAAEVRVKATLDALGLDELEFTL